MEWGALILYQSKDASRTKLPKLLLAAIKVAEFLSDTKGTSDQVGGCGLSEDL
jgi:hypothetical protein